VRRNRDTVRASEIGTFLYCRRAWWYQRQGEPSENQAELLTGAKMHEQHGRVVLAAVVLRAAGYALLLLALVLLTIYLLNTFLTF